MCDYEFCPLKGVPQPDPRALGDGMLAHWLSVAAQSDWAIEKKVRESGLIWPVRDDEEGQEC
jgi:hypothetical protein